MSACPFTEPSLTATANGEAVIQPGSLFQSSKRSCTESSDTLKPSNETLDGAKSITAASFVVGRLGLAKIVYEELDVGNNRLRKRDDGLMTKVLSQTEKQTQRERRPTDARDAIRGVLRKRSMRKLPIRPSSVSPAVSLHSPVCSNSSSSVGSISRETASPLTLPPIDITHSFLDTTDQSYGPTLATEDQMSEINKNTSPLKISDFFMDDASFNAWF
ncbi:transcriptional activator [Schizosaccharomyces japonicus yFS275]|uniref:Transcriptional activator n=1 Tax=Schizosaccharomyces japonicus (strain yFS275 / FY16936) TaxID=402676 RepID=B6JYR2_SCHJY|nr:transcriptional activator [Schizosaccharomyces japonicus yFS275]EEB06680.1 transcriptional activator [Schizosaccharomyces japonicus yFS275]